MAGTFLYGTFVWTVVAIIYGVLAHWGSDEQRILLGVHDGAWTAGFWIGCLVVLVMGVVRLRRCGAPSAAIPLALIIFVAPGLLYMAGIASLQTFLLSHHPAVLGAKEMFGPLMVVFYFLGTVYFWWTARREGRGSFLTFLLPPLVLTALMLGATSVQVLASDEFRYHRVLHFTLQTSDLDGETGTFSGVLEVKRGGEYYFSAPFHGLTTSEEEELAELSWPEGRPENPVQPGTYPILIEIPITHLGDDLMYEEVYLYLQVKVPSNGARRTVRSFHIYPGHMR